ncbi:MAG: Gfo/Idh/MocA family oxidoreductase [Deltaproteobacteria bacterium]|nr:Gfo/Idh/MocA family oxidoreductase [Deltaproteobacteria bacterium]
MKEDKLKICVIGVGHLGQFHVQKYKAHPDVEILGVVDTNCDRAVEIGNRYGVRAYSDYKEVLPMADAVSLAVPTESHFAVAKDILSEGKHLLIEKPITYQMGPADTLIKMAEDRGLILQVGLVERFNPAVVKMESMLNKPLFIESHRMNNFTTRGTDVDVVLDLMIHDLDIILHIAGSDVKDIHAVGMSVVTGKTDVANARLVFENGITANLTASRVSDRVTRKIRVFQPNGYLLADCHKREFYMTRMDNGKRDASGVLNLQSLKEVFPNSDPLADQIDYFVRSVINGAKPVMRERDERKALNIALSIIDIIKKDCGEFHPQT